MNSSGTSIPPSLTVDVVKQLHLSIPTHQTTHSTETPEGAGRTKAAVRNPAAAATGTTADAAAAAACSGRSASGIATHVVYFYVLTSRVLWRGYKS